MVVSAPTLSLPKAKVDHASCPLPTQGPETQPTERVLTAPVDAFQSPAVREPSVARTLFRRWKQGEYRVRVGDAELAPAVEALFFLHHDIGFFSQRHQGMALVGGQGTGADELEFQLVPNRRYDRKTGGLEVAGCSCPFCQQDDPTASGGKALNWRGYRVIPNAFPYAPATSHHTVIASEGHTPQSFSPSLLEDMIDYSHLFGRRVTMHYNGIAGNSQQHLHWHATRETVPLQKKLDEGTLPLDVLRQSDDGRLAAYDHGFFRGFVLEGSKRFVSRWAQKVVDLLDKDPQVRGHYNMLLLPSGAQDARLIIVPRRADHVEVEVEGLDKPLSYGALGVAGRLIIEHTEVPAGAAEAVHEGGSKTMVPPAEIEGLSTLRSAPEARGALARLAWG